MVYHLELQTKSCIFIFISHVYSFGLSSTMGSVLTYLDGTCEL